MVKLKDFINSLRLEMYVNCNDQKIRAIIADPLYYIIYQKVRNHS